MYCCERLTQVCCTATGAEVVKARLAAMKALSFRVMAGVSEGREAEPDAAAAGALGNWSIIMLSALACAAA